MARVKGRETSSEKREKENRLAQSMINSIHFRS